MQLGAIQQQLERLYDSHTGLDLNDYLLTDPRVAQALCGSPLQSQEALLVQQSGDGMAVSLYLDPGLVQRFEDHDPEKPWSAAVLNDFWMVLEGISHLLAVAWRAASDRSTSAVELELQAEIDKFVLTQNALDHYHGPSPREHLHHALFGCSRFLPELARPLQQRYRHASRLAETFCRSLARRFDLHPDDSGLRKELQRFYRLDWRRKLRHIDQSSR